MEKKADLMASDLEGDNVLMMAISQNHLDIAAGCGVVIWGWVCQDRKIRQPVICGEDI